ncbi:hydroxymethylglutaryl-CoA synthase [Candidatus Bathyarchaeota archaeon]|nr:hydroxymethylglutaryl-CoA synthase [Candidatus Bathyarchaeota archaeon]
MAEVGIVGYGVYIPASRVDTLKIVERREKGRKDLPDLIAKVRDGLLLRYKAIADPNEDVTTLATEAAENALIMGGIEPEDVGSVIVGSESKPYAVGSTARHVASFIGVGTKAYVSDIEGACNAGLQAVNFIRAQISSGEVKYGLAIGSDIAQAPKGDPLEYATGAGAAAFLLGNGKESVAGIVDMAPYSSLFMDFWRREGYPVPRHFGKTTVESYIRHVTGAISMLLKRHKNLALSNFKYITFHQPSGYMPLKTCRTLLESPEEYITEGDIRERAKLTKEEIQEKVMPWLKVVEIGNTYSASTMIGIASILDKAEPDEDVLAVSYGSGAYAIAMWLKTREPLPKRRGRVPGVEDYIRRGYEISPPLYEKYMKYHVADGKRTLPYPRIIGRIEPSTDSVLQLQICEGCRRIYYPPREKCLEWECEGPLRIHEFPVRAKLLDYLRIPLRGRLLSKYDIFKGGYVPLVDLNKEDLKEGLELEAVIRRISVEGTDGLIHYGVCYRPIFRAGRRSIKG